MKKLISYVCLACLVSVYNPITAQEYTTISEDLLSDYLNRNPIYDYSELQLNNTDTIPDFATKQDKLMITGTIYQSDGTTPAKGVILYMSQTDENGDFELKTINKKRYVYHRGWIKTNADGKYTFYTFVPGSDRRFNEMKHIHTVIKEPGKPEQDIDAFLFDDDPLLTKHCRKLLAKKNINSILKPIKKDDLLMATMDIVLKEGILESK
jgi:protocatechuate 3,4-dioxygenase beta subunit